MEFALIDGKNPVASLPKEIGGKMVLATLLSWDRGNWELRSCVPEEAGAQGQLLTIEALVVTSLCPRCMSLRKNKLANTAKVKFT